MQEASEYSQNLCLNISEVLEVGLVVHAGQMCAVSVSDIKHLCASCLFIISAHLFAFLLLFHIIVSLSFSLASVLYSHFLDIFMTLLLTQTGVQLFQMYH